MKDWFTELCDFEYTFCKVEQAKEVQDGLPHFWGVHTLLLEAGDLEEVQLIRRSIYFMKMLKLKIHLPPKRTQTYLKYFSEELVNILL